MRSSLILALLGVLCVAGCSMAAPGVARVQAAPPPRMAPAPAGLAGDKSWADPYPEQMEKNSIGQTELGTDFSKRELGVRYFGKDDTLDNRKPKPQYASGAEKRQAERREARVKAARENGELVGPSNPARQ